MFRAFLNYGGITQMMSSKYMHSCAILKAAQVCDKSVYGPLKNWWGFKMNFCLTGDFSYVNKEGQKHVLLLNMAHVIPIYSLYTRFYVFLVYIGKSYMHMWASLHINRM
jgi:hypothetical protein